MISVSVREVRRSGMAMLLLNLFLSLVSIGAIIAGAILLSDSANTAIGVTLMVASFAFLCLVSPFLYAGLKVLKPNEALVLTLFGKYYGTLKGSGFFFVNPFVTAATPATKGNAATAMIMMAQAAAESKTGAAQPIVNSGSLY